jgi:hypothetical protein
MKSRFALVHIHVLRADRHVSVGMGTIIDASGK